MAEEKIEKEQKDSKEKTHHEIHHEHATHSVESSNASSDMKFDPWKTAVVILAIVCLVLLYNSFFHKTTNVTGNSISTTAIGEKAVKFINEQLLQGQGTVTLANVSEKGSLYEVNVDFNGKTVPAYFTKDGEYFVGTQIFSLSTPIASANRNSSSAANSPSTTAPKTAKPSAEAFVFAYCPYGLQFEKALIPVYKLLKDKADISITFIGAMHGDFEKVESYRQLCVNKLYGKDKLFDYIENFASDTNMGNCNGDANCTDPLIDKIYTKLGMDKTKINSCMATDADALYQADEQKASQLGQSGSPGFMVNGADIQVGRSPDAIMKAICSAFTTAPAECNQTVSTASASPGFGGASASAGSSGASCGA